MLQEVLRFLWQFVLLEVFRAGHELVAVGSPVLGSGVFVGGANDGGRLDVQRLETGAIYVDGKIPVGTANQIAGGVFAVYGAHIDSVANHGPVITYGANDMALDNWGVVDTWVHTPRGKTFEKRFLTKDDATKVLGAFSLRERTMIKLAAVSGMRPGEIVGLQWADVKDDAVYVKRRVYRHKIDTPKTTNSIRRAALPPSLIADLREWRSLYPSAGPENWVFPSEHGKSPVSPGNVWRRNINPILKKLGLSWVNYQVLRRSCSSLLNDLGVEGKVVADQLGHTLDVNQNVYTRVALERQRTAVGMLDAILQPMESRGVLN